MSTLFTQDYSRALVVGAGSLGCLAARLGDEDGEESAAVWSAAHIDSAELIATGLERKLFLKMSDGPFAARSIAQSIDENSAALERLSRGRDAAILCGELSDPVAMRLLEAMSYALTDFDIAVFALVIEPFSPNGEVDSDSMEHELKRLSQSVPFVCALNPGMENVSAGIAVKRVRKIAAERLAAVAECFAGALTSEHERAPHVMALRGLHRAVYASVPHVARVAPGVKTSSSQLAFDAAIRSFDVDSAECIQAAIVSSASEISFRDTQAITQRLPGGAALLATANPARVGLVECLLLSGQERAANVVSIGAAFGTARAFSGAEMALADH
ncbi:MAG: hypothetical protein WCT04_06835 [Planctomycetota bacterium]